MSFLFSTPPPPKLPSPLLLGILGATASINKMAIIDPISTHPGVVLYAVAGRILESAEKARAKCGAQKAYGGFQELLDDEAVGAVYISLPNGLHAEWAIKSMRAGKHVLIEKPIAANASEALEILQVSRETGMIALEAYHNRFHPATLAAKALISSGELGAVVSTKCWMNLPAGVIKPSDIRYNYDLAGGGLMDLCYVVAATEYLVGAEEVEVVQAKAKVAKADGRIDEGMEASLRLKMEGGRVVDSEVECCMVEPWIWGVLPNFWKLGGIELEMEHGRIYYSGFVGPHLYHYISIKDNRTGKTRIEKHYKTPATATSPAGPSWWTYRHQLEAFVDKINGNQPAAWVSLEESVGLMKTVDAIYEKSGLGKRHSPAWK